MPRKRRVAGCSMAALATDALPARTVARRARAVQQRTTAVARSAAHRPAEPVAIDPDKPAAADEVFLGRGETILLVDDEASVREMAVMVLRRLNFQPLTAVDGAEGLVRAAQHQADLRVVITDLHMPHMDGLVFVRALRRNLPVIPVVVASGRMEESVAREFSLLGVSQVVDKPFTEAQLARALQRALAG